VTVRPIKRDAIPQAWIVLAKQGRDAKWIAKELGVEDWRVVHRALMGCGAYRF
jgi:hypothetical protein